MGYTVPREEFSQRKRGLRNFQQELRYRLSHTAEFVYLQSQASALVFHSYSNILESCGMRCVSSKLL